MWRLSQHRLGVGGPASPTHTASLRGVQAGDRSDESEPRWPVTSMSRQTRAPSTLDMSQGVRVILAVPPPGLPV